MNSNKLLETGIYKSGNTEKFCLLCGYDIKHTEEDHTGMLNFSPDAEFLDGLKKVTLYLHVMVMQHLLGGITKHRRQNILYRTDLLLYHVQMKP